MTGGRTVRCEPTRARRRQPRSGAFAISKASKLAGIEPRYLITLGNQMDLTVSDYLEHLQDDPATEVFAVYLEGFHLLDGARFLRAIEAISRSGRTVVLYRAGRTPAGTGAAASHTAAVAGDSRVTRRVAEAAGAVVAESLEDFEDLVRLFTVLRGNDPGGLSRAKPHPATRVSPSAKLSCGSGGAPAAVPPGRFRPTRCAVRPAAQAHDPRGPSYASLHDYDRERVSSRAACRRPSGREPVGRMGGRSQ